MRGMFSTGALRPLLKSSSFVSYVPVSETCFPFTFRTDVPPISFSKSFKFGLMAKSICSQLMKAGTEPLGPGEKLTSNTPKGKNLNVQTPEHALAGARGLAQYHSSAYFHHAGESRDSNNSPALQKEHAKKAIFHQDKYHEHAAKISEFEKQGIQDSAKHHNDLQEYHQNATDDQLKSTPYYEDGVNRRSMRGVHGEFFRRMRDEKTSIEEPTKKQKAETQYTYDEEHPPILEGFSPKESQYAHTLVSKVVPPNAPYAEMQRLKISNSQETVAAIPSKKLKSSDVAKSLALINILINR